jgi:hypothetical protein
MGAGGLVDFLDRLTATLQRPNARQMGESLTLRLWRAKTFPVDPTEIARDLGVVVEPNPELPEGQFAQALNLQGRDRIEYRPGESVKRLRFAIAHCLGHVLLKHGTSPVETVETFSRRAVDLQESDANAFALGLLIPAATLRHMIEVRGMTSVVKIAEVYDVSEVAIAERLKELRLI